jgi:folate-binding protein YgfZ
MPPATYGWERMETKIQVEAAHRAVLAISHPDLATLVVTGRDRVSWVNGLLTCDLVKRAPGHAVYGLAVARNGRVLSDATVVVDDASASVLVAVPHAVASPLRVHLEHYLVMEDAEMASRTDSFAVWALHGPGSAAVLDAACSAGGAGGSIDRTGLGGAFVLAPIERGEQVRDAIERALLVVRGSVGDDAGWEALRLERAVARFGVDFDDTTYPQEASLEKSAVSFDKGCYLGQEVVCMLELRGHVKRRLVPLVLDAGQPPSRGTVVTDAAGAVVGEVSSAARSPTLGKPVALAAIKRVWAEAGKRVFVAGVAAEVVERPA